MKNEKLDRIIAYTVGICSASVCVEEDCKKSEIEKYMNAYHGVIDGYRWKISKDKTFKDGQSNPCPCDKYPNRKHYLLNC